MMILFLWGLIPLMDQQLTKIFSHNPCYLLRSYLLTILIDQLIQIIYRKNLFCKDIVQIVYFWYITMATIIWRH